MNRAKTEAHLMLHGWIPTMRLNGSAYKMIDPSTAVYVTINRAARDIALRDDYYGPYSGDILKRKMQSPDAPDYSHLEDRFFWMLWEHICKIESTQFDRRGWSLL